MLRSHFEGAIALPLILCGTHALAQSATVAVAHSDPDGLVSPGQTVQITTTLTWAANGQVCRIAGDLMASPNLGAASNPSSVLPPTSGFAYLRELGVPTGGSIVGFDGWNRAIPLPGTIVVPPWGSSPLAILTYEWTAPATPGVVRFDWMSRPDIPHPSYWPLGGQTPEFFATTYVGTSLTVIPGPAPAACLAVGLGLGSMRRRRSPD